LFVIYSFMCGSKPRVIAFFFSFFADAVQLAFSFPVY
jgi:hypothetical protein